MTTQKLYLKAGKAIDIGLVAFISTLNDLLSPADADRIIGTAAARYKKAVHALPDDFEPGNTQEEYDTLRNEAMKELVQGA